MNKLLSHRAFCGFMLFLSSQAGMAAPTVSSSVSIYPKQVGQTVGGIGGGIVYYQDWVTNHPYREAVYDTLFNGLGLSCLRIGNWATENNDKCNRDVDNDAIIVKAYKQYCGDDMPLFMSAWSASASLKACNSINGSNSTGKASLKKVNGQFVYSDYGKWWAESLNRYRQRGVYPDFISIQNEPDSDQPDYASMIFNATETSNVASYGKALAAAYAEVNKLSNPPKFVGPDNIGIGWEQTQEYVNALDKSLLSGYAFHYYHSGVNGDDRYSHPNDFIEAMRGLATDLADKPMFMTENSALRTPIDEDGLYTAWFIANAFNINKVQYYMHWNLIWGDNADGCIQLQKWDSTYAAGKKWAYGMNVRPEYHGLRHFSKFVRPGMKVIGTWASTDQMTTCGFMMPDSSLYTLVFINQGDTNRVVTHDLDIDTKSYSSQVTLTCASQKIFSKNMGAYNKSVTMPGHSIVTITYKRTHKDVSPYIFIFDEVANNGLWTNPTNWNTGYKPWSTDSLIIRKGECKLNNFNHNNGILVESGGIFRLTGDVTVNSTLHLVGGTIKVYTSNPGFVLHGKGISVEQPSVFNVGHEVNQLYLDDQLYGSAVLEKTGVGILNLLTVDTTYSGNWHVRTGTLQASAWNALGTGNVEVMGGALLRIDQPCEINELILQYDSTLLLNADLTVQNAYLGGQGLPNGRYTSEDYPDYIMGGSTLIVNHPYPVIVKQGAGHSYQTVSQDSSIVDYNYAWKYAETVAVAWAPHQPEGISVTINDWEQKVYFSGTPTEAGTFTYTVSTVSMEDSVFVKSGLLTVNEHDADVDVVVDADVLSMVLTPNVVKCGNNAILSVNMPTGQQGVVTLQNCTGVTLFVMNVTLNQGRNTLELPTSTLPSGLYLVTLRQPLGTCTLKLVVE